MTTSKRIVVVIGKVCSGKDTFAQLLLDRQHIDIGSIVRKIKNSDERIHDVNLDHAIKDVLTTYLINQSDTPFVITGIRQLSILRLFIDGIFNTQCELIYLDVPEVELKRRFINRNADKDQNLTFEEIIKRDADLGLAEIEEFIKFSPQLFTILQNY